MPFVPAAPVSSPEPVPLGNPFARDPRVAVFVRDPGAAEYAVRTSATQSLGRTLRELTADPMEARWSPREGCWRVASYLSGRLAQRLRTDGWVVAGDATW